MLSKYFAKRLYVFVEICHKGFLALGVIPPISLIACKNKEKKLKENPMLFFYG